LLQSQTFRLLPSHRFIVTRPPLNPMRASSKKLFEKQISTCSSSRVKVSLNYSTQAPKHFIIC
jgi:hypothetical protein